jgi:ferric hydroxamate transport system substrate-binding protein
MPASTRSRSRPTGSSGPSRTSRALAVPTAALAVFLAVACVACGTTEPAAQPSSTSSTAASVGPVASGPAEGGSGALTDERGTVDLDGPATRVVALDWGLTENLLALGVEPVGVADVAGYNVHDTVEPLDPATPDVGPRAEPNLEAIVALAPNLVVATTDLPSNVLDQLATAATVITLRGSDANDPIGSLRRVVTTLARATGTESQGEQLLADLQAKIVSAEQELVAAGDEGAPIVLADGYLSAGTVTIRPYTPGSLFGALTAEIGLDNQWIMGGDANYGIASTDLEGLATITNPDTSFLYVASGASDDAVASNLGGNAVWGSLPFVVSGNVHRLPNGIWMFGGTSSAVAFLDAVVDALVT